MVIPLIDVPCTFCFSFCNILYIEYTANFSSILIPLKDKKSWLVQYENGINASFPTPTRVTIAIEFLGTNFVADFDTASSEICFLGTTSKS